MLLSSDFINATKFQNTIYRFICLWYFNIISNYLDISTLPLSTYAQVSNFYLCIKLIRIEYAFYLISQKHQILTFISLKFTSFGANWLELLTLIFDFMMIILDRINFILLNSAEVYQTSIIHKGYRTDGNLLGYIQWSII